MIRYISSTTFSPKDHYGIDILPLSFFENADYPGSPPIECLVLYKKKTSLPAARESFLETIRHYNLFSSRLIMIDENRFALLYCTDGFQYMVLPPLDADAAHISIDDVRHMMRHVKTLPGEPLFAVTIIPVRDGLLGGISCSHAIGDAVSLMLFLYAWGCIHYGNSFSKPSTQRLFSGSPVVFDTFDSVFAPPVSDLHETIRKRVENSQETTRYHRREYFSDKRLAEMKNGATSENENYRLSNNQIINAVLLKKYHNGIMPGTDQIRLRIPINLRYIHPDVDPLYIGNAVFSAVIGFSRAEINRMSVYRIACRLKEAIAKMRNEHYVRRIVCLSKFGIRYRGDIFKTLPPYNPDTDILAANLTHVNDLESLGLGDDVGRILYMGSTMQTSFTMLKEKHNRLFAEIRSRYPLESPTTTHGTAEVP